MFQKIKTVWRLIRLGKAIKKARESLSEGDPMKRGINTTEFWIPVVLTIVTILNQLIGKPLDDAMLLKIATLIAGIIVAYIASRATVKVAEIVKGAKKAGGNK